MEFPHERRGYAVCKRLLDVAVSLALLVALSPLFLLVAVLVKCTSRGPVLFRQERAGRGRRHFTVLKFRSMREDAHEERPHLEQHNVMDGPVFKMHGDPRITAVGRFLRRTSLDELPQLVNVLRGEMSLVGPRPLPVDEADRLAPAYQRRHDVRPGLTGLWQVCGRNDLPYERMMALDLAYVAHRSFLLDLRILAATVPAVLSGRGAR
jgi:exopolysaccharide biosynthesis polyprenyl glycosylphosphotransferase